MRPRERRFLRLVKKGFYGFVYIFAGKIMGLVLSFKVSCTMHDKASHTLARENTIRVI